MTGDSRLLIIIFAWRAHVHILLCILTCNQLYIHVMQWLEEEFLQYLEEWEQSVRSTRCCWVKPPGRAWNSQVYIIDISVCLIFYLVFIFITSVIFIFYYLELKLFWVKTFPRSTWNFIGCQRQREESMKTPLLRSLWKIHKLFKSSTQRRKRELQGQQRQTSWRCQSFNEF